MGRILSSSRISRRTAKHGGCLLVFKFNDLEKKRVAVAGALGLIGREISSALLNAGADVVTIDPAEGPAKYRFDVGDAVSVRAILADVGWIDVWINASYPMGLQDHIGAYHTATCMIADHMVGQMSGSIINFASIYGVVGSKPAMYEGTDIQETPTWYAAAKGAIISLTRAIACKYGAAGIRANCISPGGVRDRQSMEFVHRYSERVPLGRMAYPADLVGPVLFLASDASAYITGQNLVVDGGMTAW